MGILGDVIEARDIDKVREAVEELGRTYRVAVLVSFEDGLLAVLAGTGKIRAELDQQVRTHQERQAMLEKTILAR